jgi:sporulation protein YqfC
MRYKQLKIGFKTELKTIKHNCLDYSCSSLHRYQLRREELFVFKKLQTNVGDILDFPADVAGEGPKITITGRRQVLIENFISILNFSEEEIRLETAEGDVCLYGKGFVLKVMLAKELSIEGELSSVSYGEER